VNYTCLESALLSGLGHRPSR